MPLCNAETRALVSVLAAHGIPHSAIAGFAGTKRTSLQTYYPDELRLGLYQATARVAQALLRAALGDGPEGAVRAQMFWLRVKAGWGRPPGRLPGECLSPIERRALDVLHRKMQAGS
jgi:hypothetical protein